MFVFLIIIGGVSTIEGTKAAWASAIMLLCWSIAYQFSVCVSHLDDETLDLS
jgi:hypothetical protein